MACGRCRYKYAYELANSVGSFVDRFGFQWLRVTPTFLIHNASQVQRIQLQLLKKRQLTENTQENRLIQKMICA